MTDYGFIRASTGSQDVASQERDIREFSPNAIIVRTENTAASASKGEQLDALDAVIAKLRKGDRIIVTDSSRLDRRENLWDQLATVMAILGTGATVLSLDPDEDDFAVDPSETIERQKANAAKSRVVKKQTWRGVKSIIANKAAFGPVPVFWETRGERFAKQAVCASPDTVKDVYERIADGETLASVARVHGTWAESLKILIKWPANHTGVIECSYSHDGITEHWPHKVTPVVDSDLWWRANKALNKPRKGGRPVAPHELNWLSGALDCPACGGKLYLLAGETRAGNQRIPVLRCVGPRKARKTCGKFKPAPAAPIAGHLNGIFADSSTPLLSFQRVAGNQHELDSLNASLQRVQASLSSLEDDDELELALAERKRLRIAIGSFELVPDEYDHAPAGQTLGQMWRESDENKGRIVKAVKAAFGLRFAVKDEGWEFILNERNIEFREDGIVDLGGGVCFRYDAWLNQVSA